MSPHHPGLRFTLNKPRGLEAALFFPRPPFDPQEFICVSYSRYLNGLSLE